MNTIIDLATYEDLSSYLDELKLEYKRLEEDLILEKKWIRRYYKTDRSKKIKATVNFVDEKNAELIDAGAEILIDKEKSLSKVKTSEKDYYKYILSEWELNALEELYYLESEISEIESILSSVLRRVA